MNYNILNNKAPRVPALGRGTECIKLLLSQASEDMIEPLIPMLFPVLGAHISNTEFLFPDQSWKQPCGMMANLVAESGGNKGQLTALVEAICKDFRNDLFNGTFGRMVFSYKPRTSRDGRIPRQAGYDH